MTGEKRGHPVLLEKVGKQWPFWEINPPFSVLFKKDLQFCRQLTHLLTIVWPRQLAQLQLSLNVLYPGLCALWPHSLYDSWFLWEPFCCTTVLPRWPPLMFPVWLWGRGNTVFLLSKHSPQNKCWGLLIQDGKTAHSWTLLILQDEAEKYKKE